MNSLRSSVDFEGGKSWQSSSITKHLINLLRGHHFLAQESHQTGKISWKKIFTKEKKETLTSQMEKPIIISRKKSRLLLPGKLTNVPWNQWLVSYWNSPFLGDMLVFGGVKVTIFPKNLRPHPSAASLDLWSSDAGVGRKEDMLPPSPDILATGKNHPKDLGIFVFSRNVEQTKNNMKVDKLQLKKKNWPASAGRFTPETCRNVFDERFFWKIHNLIGSMYGVYLPTSSWCLW